MLALALPLLFSRCYVPLDTTPGWKRVELTDELRDLAAPREIDQLRSDERFLLWDDDRPFATTTNASFGRVTMRFEPRRPDHPYVQWIRHLEVELQHPLDGAAVDATGFGDDANRFLERRLFEHRRVQGTMLSVDWDDRDIAGIELAIHHHLRGAPILLRWRAGRETRLDSEPWIFDGFRSSSSLYYLQPPGRGIELCTGSDVLPAARVLSLDGSLGAPRTTRIIPR
jgi:hypothetical protein